MKIEKKREKIGNVDFFASKVFIWEFAAEIQLYQSDSVYDRKFRNRILFPKVLLSCTLTGEQTDCQDLFDHKHHVIC